MVWAAATMVAVLAAVVARGRTEHRTDPKAERRLRFWSGPPGAWLFALAGLDLSNRKSTRLNSSHGYISYAVFCLKKKKTKKTSIMITQPSHTNDTTYRIWRHSISSAVV